MDDQELVGVKIVDKSVSVVGQDIVGNIAVAHVGKLGSLELSLKGKFEFMPLAEKAIDGSIDFIEKKIPGDQTLYAEGLKGTLKTALSKIKF